jgi:hypothetical protein
VSEKKRKPKRRIYTLADLVAIAQQLGCVVRFELLPAPPEPAKREETWEP